MFGVCSALCQLVFLVYLYIGIDDEFLSTYLNVFSRKLYFKVFRSFVRAVLSQHPEPLLQDGNLARVLLGETIPST